MKDCILSLDGAWRLRAADESESISCQIPGDNYSALQAAGRIPDPYWRRNELAVQWVADKDWSFSREFVVPAGLLGHRAVYLDFASIDTFAEIFVNGRLAGKADNQFFRWRFEVKKLLREGTNEIEVRIASPRRRALEVHDAEAPDLPAANMNDGSIKGINCIRKCQCSAGWDWGVSLPASGLYGGVSLIGADEVLIDAAWCDQTHRSGSCRVDATLRLVPVRGAKPGASVEARLRFNGEERIVRGRVPAAPGPFELKASFRVDSPRLWWPCGYGEQPLYEFSAEVGAQRIERKVGLRKLEVVRKPDKAGESFKIRVNGVDVFAKGADWIPCDARPAHETEARIRHLLESAAAANMNTLRVWGGGHFESDFFYDECDRLGLLIWHDMMMACMRYPKHAAFLGRLRAEIGYQVRRLRDHAAIALWCGDNENIGAIHWNVENDTPAARKARIAYYRVVNRAVGEAVREADPSRLFWPSSPCAAPGDYTYNDGESGRGDTHYWAVWFGGATFDAYYRHRPRFCSEFGFQSFPSPETVRTFASEREGDLNIYSPVFDQHQKSRAGNSIILGMFANYYRAPKGFDETLYLSQVQQSEAIRTGVEWWRSLRPHCMGTVFWQLDDDWPCASWSSIEYGGRWKALHYAARRFYAPLATFAFRPGARKALEAHVVWDLPLAVDVKVAVTLHRLSDGTPVGTWKFREKLDRAGTRTLPLPAAIAAALPDRTGRREGVLEVAPGLTSDACFLVVETEGRDSLGRVWRHGTTVALEAWKALDLPQSGLAVKSVEPAKDEKGAFDVTLTAKAPSFFAWASVADDSTGVFSDNLVTVLPDAPKVLRYRPGTPTTASSLRRRISLIDLRGSY